MPATAPVIAPNEVADGTNIAIKKSPASGATSMFTTLLPTSIRLPSMRLIVKPRRITTAPTIHGSNRDGSVW